MEKKIIRIPVHDIESKCGPILFNVLLRSYGIDPTKKVITWFDPATNDYVVEGIKYEEKNKH